MTNHTNNIRTRHTVSVLAGLLLGFLVALPALGQVQEAAPPPTTQPAAEANRPAITAAVLTFEAKLRGNETAGQEIADTLSVLLADEPSLRLVERQEINRVLTEHELNLSGLAANDRAVRVGQLTGAQLLITGRVFTLGDKLMIAAKVIGTETTRVSGVLVRGQPTELDELVVRLAEDLRTKLHDEGASLLPADAPADPLVALQRQLAGRTLPRVAVVVLEEHQQGPRPAAGQAPDPAVETELKRALLAAGFDIRDVQANELADFAANLRPTDVGAWPRGLTDVDVIITGKAFSERGGQIGNLISCSARAEINVIQRSDGRIVMAERAAARAVDLSENMAAKSALQQAGHDLAVVVLRHFVESTAPSAGAGEAVEESREPAPAE